MLTLPGHLIEYDADQKIVKATFMAGHAIAPWVSGAAQVADSRKAAAADAMAASRAAVSAAPFWRQYQPTPPTRWQRALERLHLGELVRAPKPPPAPFEHVPRRTLASYLLDNPRHEAHTVNITHLLRG